MANLKLFTKPSPLISFHQTPSYYYNTCTATSSLFTHSIIIPRQTTSSSGSSRRMAPLPVTKASGDERNPSVISPVAENSSSTASEVVRSFYRGINAHDLPSVVDLIAEDCVYEDLIFPNPFLSRKAILEFFNKFIDSISMDLQFVIDDISAEDSSAVGVTWHLEWKGKAFPFSKGCSFYRLKVVNGNRQIVYGRDSVEPTIKPGETTLVAIRGVTWLLQQFPQLADWL